PPRFPYPTLFRSTLGTLPIALALGAGAESRTPMGLAVIGGLAVGTLLSLFVVPAMYTFFAGEHVHVETEEEAAAPVAVTADGAAVLAGGDGAADGTAGVPQAAAREEAADA